jgi:hypothetical protein
MWPFCSNWAEVDFSEEITNSRINNNWERVYDEDSEEEIIVFDYENLPIEVINFKLFIRLLSYLAGSLNLKHQYIFVRNLLIARLIFIK